MWFPLSWITWFITIVTSSLSAAWLAYDLRNLWRLRAADRRDPLVRDKVFGYSIGVVTALVGLLGVLKYHLS
jgi:hypothetical protein